MPKYTRLREHGAEEGLDQSSFEYFELPHAGLQSFQGKNHGGDLEGAGDFDVQRTSKEHSILSIGILSSSMLNPMKSPPDKHRVQQSPTQQNIENGNPNVSPSHAQQSGTPSAAAHSQDSIGASLREKRGTAPVSNRWSGRNLEDKSGRWMNESPDPLGRNEGAHPRSPVEVLEDKAVVQQQWTPSIQRVASYRECAAPALDHSPSQGRDDPPCNLHSLCTDVRQSERFTLNIPAREMCNESSSPRLAMSTVVDKKPLISTVTRAFEQSSVSDAEFWETHQERSAKMRRSSSTRDDCSKPKSEMSIENWRNHPASRSIQSSAVGRHRVSFSLLENHHELELKREFQQQQREKRREPIFTLGRGLFSKNPDPLRYNYEQPGFVEREKDALGRPYTIYRVEGGSCRVSSGAQPSLSKAFSSVRERGSSYTRLSRTYSASSETRTGPVECVTCGRGLGIVVHEFAGNDVSLCNSCKPPAGVAAVRGIGSRRWKFSDSNSAGSKVTKKKGMLDYCKKLLGLSKKTRN